MAKHFDPRRLDEPLNMPISLVADELVAVLGSRRIVALLSGLKSLKEVSAWTKGRQRPTSDRATILRTALQAARLIEDLESRDSVRAWFMGTNPIFNFEAPALVLRERGTEGCGAVMRAAHVFVAESMAAADVLELQPAALA